LSKLSGALDETARQSAERLLRLPVQARGLSFLSGAAGDHRSQERAAQNDNSQTAQTCCNAQRAVAATTAVFLLRNHDDAASDSKP
jgi:hypothetical protein